MMGCFSLLIMIGVYQDGWAHNHGLVDQSFITPWHAILYGTMAVTGIALGIAGVRNLLRGYTVRNGLPYGYWTSAIGVVVFLFGGVFDMWWHTVFGIEVNIQALISPSHLILALGGGLVLAGVLRSIAHQYDPRVCGWKKLGPAILASVGVLMLLGFFTQYASPFSDNTMEAIMARYTPAGSALYSVRADGAAQTRLLSIAGTTLSGVAISPDARHIAYSSAQGNSGDERATIALANAIGSQAHTIVANGRRNIQPAWSPDGSKIAFISLPAGTSGEFQLHTIAANGSGDRVVAHSVTRMYSPAWLPHGGIVVASRNGVTDQLAQVSLASGALSWVAGTQGAASVATQPTGAIAFENDDGDVMALDAGSKRASVLAKDAQRPRFSPNGRYLVYLRGDGSEVQAFLAEANGLRTHDVSRLQGLSAQTASVANDGTVFFTAAGHSPAVQTGIGTAYGVDGVIISSVVLMGILLVFLRRWLAPAGAMTALIGLYSIALATQSDMYYVLPAAIAVAIAADVYVALLADRARNGLPFYAFAFSVPAALFAGYEICMNAHLRGLGWAPNIVAGAPFIAGFCGLLVAYCWRVPLPEPEAHPSADLREPFDLAENLGPRVPAAK